MKLTIPEQALVVLIGPSGSGKSTFAKRHFRASEVLSSDACRGLVADDENDQSASAAAFEVLHKIAQKRLEAARLTVVDATNVQEGARKPLVALARDHDCLPVAIVLDLPERVCHERNRGRADRDFGPHVVRQHKSQLERSLRRLKAEGFRHVHVLRTVEEVEAVEIVRAKLWNDRRDDHGPFDVIGDVHGCRAELGLLLETLGYELGGTAAAPTARHPAGRKVVFLGDLVDRGPDSPGVLRLAMAMVRSGDALCVPGNHDVKLMRKLRGENERVAHGLAETLAQLEPEPPEFLREVADFVEDLVSHYVLDSGKLVVAHAGLKQAYQGRASGRVRAFCLFGETTGETDEYGLPVRFDWASQYRGAATVAYGHTPVPEAKWVNRTLCIDTGCVFGGRLTALRYPENELVSVPAQRVHYEPIRPLEATASPTAASPSTRADDVLDLQDVLGKRIVETRIHRTVTLREENAAAALEVMSRFACDPRWLVYLPPTMSPPDTRRAGPALEHPDEVFAYFAAQGVEEVVCQEKHMGSRAVVIACRSAEAAEARFGAGDGRDGIVTTRTGRPFFAHADWERAVLGKLRDTLAAADFWREFDTDWVCLDAELLPWSAKAEELLRGQYAAVGCAATAALGAALPLLEAAGRRTQDGAEAAAVLDHFRLRAAAARDYVEAYRRYCWRVDSVEDLELAPFHLLATEGRVHTDKDQLWHIETLGRLCDQSAGFLRRTAMRTVELASPESRAAATQWWEELTAAGGEGMVVKPRDWSVQGKHGLVQPAIKCRGREYLRIIYGPEYLLPENLARLRERALASKRSLALREYALGLEGLHRFVEHDALYRVHECVFGVLALESEPVDPRL